MTRAGTAPGKIILTGEYAVVFGFPGIAIPSTEQMNVSLLPKKTNDIVIDWPGVTPQSPWDAYIRRIIDLCRDRGASVAGTVRVRTNLPLGKGMGSSTALVIAVCRCLLGEDCEEATHEIEDAMNPGNSGIDFAVIWRSAPQHFVRGTPPQDIALPSFPPFALIDTGAPNETTPELVTWVRSRAQEPEVAEALRIIGSCTERLERGEDARTVIRDHHRAQVALGVVPASTQQIIADIEAKGGAAKVLGAGGRTGGGGMVLALQKR